MRTFHLNQTIKMLAGPTEAQLTSQNQWAATAFDKYHSASKTEISLSLDGKTETVLLEWDSNFSKAGMKEDTERANQGGVAMAMFVMSVFMDYSYAEQSEIGEGLDYRFMKNEPDDDDLNFLNNDHYVEISGILEESKSNTLKNRIKIKHDQIKKGSKRNHSSSVIVTLFNKPTTVKEIHK